MQKYIIYKTNNKYILKLPYNKYIVNKYIEAIKLVELIGLELTEKDRKVSVSTLDLNFLENVNIIDDVQNIDSEFTSTLPIIDLDVA